MDTRKDYRVAVEAHARYHGRVDMAELERVLEATLQSQEQPDGTSVSLTLLDDDSLQRMNQLYRGVDCPTDVLAFPTNEGEPILLGPDAPMELGDIVISVETAEEQANERGHALQAELALLAVHGCLHLLGYDHADPDERAAMWRQQDAILESLGYTPTDLGEGEEAEPDDA